MNEPLKPCQEKLDNEVIEALLKFAEQSPGRYPMCLLATEVRRLRAELSARAFPDLSKDFEALRNALRIASMWIPDDSSGDTKALSKGIQSINRIEKAIKGQA